MALAIFLIGMLVFLGHFLAAIFRQTRVPDVLILTLLGIVVGPYVFNWLRPEYLGKAGPVLTLLALIVILFEGGTSLPIQTVFSSLGRTLAVGFPTFAASCISGIGVGLYVFHDLSTAFLLGVVVSAVSSAVVLPVVQGLRMSHGARTILTLESVLTDVLCVVVVFVSIRALGEGSLPVTRILGHVAYAVMVATVLGVLGGVVWRLILGQMRKFPNTLFTEFAFVFVLYGLAEFIHASGPVAVLVFGISAVNLPERLLASVPLVKHLSVHALKPIQLDIFAEAVFLTKVFFFVFLGASLRFGSPLVLLAALAVVGITLAFRIMIIWIAMPKQTPRREVAVAAVMIPKGLTAAVLASMVVESKLPGAELLQEITFATVFVSILLTSILIPCLEIPVCRRCVDLVFWRFAPNSPAAGSVETAAHQPVVVAAAAPVVQASAVALGDAVESPSV